MSDKLLLYSAIGSYVVAFSSVGYLYYVNKKITKKESFSVMLDNKTGNVVDVNNITKNKKTFRYKKETYNLLGSNYKIGHKKYYFYVIGSADSIDIVHKENSLLSSDVYTAIMEESFTKKLNDYNTGLFQNLSMKQIIIGVGVLVFAYYIIVGQ